MQVLVHKRRLSQDEFLCGTALPCVGSRVGLRRGIGQVFAGLSRICGFDAELPVLGLEHLRLELAVFGKAHHQLGDAGR